MQTKFKYLLRRSLAYFVDVSFIYVMLMVLLQLLILAPLRHAQGLDEDWFKIGWNVQYYVWLTISLPVWLYFIMMESSKRRATLGKYLFKLKVSSVETNAKLSFGKALLRTGLKLLPWELIHLGLNLPTPVWFEETPDFRYVTLAGSLLFVVYFLSILWSRTGQSIYDNLTRTIVQSITP